MISRFIQDLCKDIDALATQALTTGQLLLSDLQNDPDFVQNRSSVKSKKDDKTELETVYVDSASPQDLIDNTHAKRFSENEVREKDIRNFIGAMSGDTSKGVFITTSTCDDSAIKKARGSSFDYSD